MKKIMPLTIGNEKHVLFRIDKLFLSQNNASKISDSANEGNTNQISTIWQGTERRDRIRAMLIISWSIHSVEWYADEDEIHATYAFMKSGIPQIVFFKFVPMIHLVVKNTETFYISLLITFASIKAIPLKFFFKSLDTLFLFYI